MTRKKPEEAALDLLRQYRRAEPSDRTRLLRRLAEALVDVRENFLRQDGTPDWTGRTHQYRQAVRELYDEAGIRGEEATSLSAAIRYHVSAVLRERLDADTLKEYGLISKTARERALDRHHEKSAILRALHSGDIAGGALLAISAARTSLDRLDVEKIDELGDAEVEVADEWLADVERRARNLRRRVKARRG